MLAARPRDSLTRPQQSRRSRRDACTGRGSGQTIRARHGIEKTDPTTFRAFCADCDPLRAEVLILGAGLQGAGLALELARRGVPVTLIDRDARALNRASLRNEGKIHLGLIYANDRSRATAFLQLEGALRFRQIVTSWVGRDEDWLVRSVPFHYLVAHDSLLTGDTLAEHYAAVEERFRDIVAAERNLDYLGTRPQRLVRRLDRAEIGVHFDASRFSTGFETAELAVHTDLLADAIRRTVTRTPAITFLPSYEARSLSEHRDGFRVEGDSPAGAWQIDAYQVVNATWENRPAFDAQLGLIPPEQLLHRLKFRLVGRLPNDLRHAPSVTMVLGRYGDVVVRNDGTAYLSWYPSCMRGWSDEVNPPSRWEDACRGEVSSEVAREVASSIKAGIAPWYPGIDAVEPLLVDAGAIVALGRTDVDDAGSQLHDRSAIGVTSFGGYHTVDPGKLTTAPLFALEAAERVQEGS